MMFREFDLDYWQMRSALGYPIPSRIEARWPHSMNMGNHYRCGMCDARKQNPHLFNTAAQEPAHEHDE
jgi:hypothetical protein